MSRIASWLASPQPDAAIELAADRVAAAMVSLRGDALSVTAHAAEPLPAGIVTPSLTGVNIVDKPAAAAALERVIERLGTRPRRVALVIPDTAVKVSLLRFDKVPARRDDFNQLVRWQLRKAAPFPVETAVVSYSPGIALEGAGREFVVEIARAETVREYEAVCEEAGLYAGLVDIATLSLLGLAGGLAAPSDDWLLVHVRPDYTSVAIMRGDDVIFYRNRPEDGSNGLPDLVHQTAMYYQDRLTGRGFARVLLAGAGGAPDAVDIAKRSLEERIEVPVETLDLTRLASLANRISAAPALMDLLGPVIGMLRRTSRDAVQA